MDLAQEKNWVDAARKDPEAFGPLFDHYYKPILNYIARRVGDVALAEDLTSEVFYKALNKLWQFQFRSLPFGAWLYRIASNEIRMHFRGKKMLFSLDRLLEEVGFDPVGETDIEAEIKAAQDLLDAQKNHAELRAHLKLLPLAYQEVIALKFFEEKKTHEIAEILGKKEGNVRVLLSRALEALRKKL